MITVKLQGGLGNQMFQYAAGKSLSIFHNTTLRLDLSNYVQKLSLENTTSRHFELTAFVGINDEVILQNLDVTFNNRFPKKIINLLTPHQRRRIYKETFFHFDKKFFNANKNTTLVGDWQSYKYFEDNATLIGRCFELKDELLIKTRSFVELLKGKNSVSVHIRRGDYLSNKLVLDWHGVLPKEYYINSIQLLSSLEKLDCILFFSDDPEWVKKELIPFIGGEIISGVISKTSYEDFNIMQNCKHNIIANSSFSWWAAFLNKHQTKKVIAPKKWFKNNPANTQDLIPKNWIRI